jgi:tRNA-2-methylthio-N6-dimethylallyladenosine synthase
MRWKDDIPEEVKQDRLHRLLELQEEIYAKHRQEMIGKEIEVLFENVSLKDGEMVKGRTRCWKNVIVRGGADLVGTLQKVTIHSYTNQTLIGTIV